MEAFDLIVIAGSLLAGAIASVAGFGIGSILTPILALNADTKIAVVAVSVPHLFATAFRFWLIRDHLDKKVLFHFGLLSAIGGLAGALLNYLFNPSAVTLIFGVILMFAGFTGASGLNEKFNFGPKTAWLMGTLSGLLGGLVGNQGGIRSAALLGFNINRDTFIATATATGLIVDGVRIPVYLLTQGAEIIQQSRFLILSTVFALIGTLLGMKILKRLSEKTFKRSVSGVILVLGIYMFYKGLNQL